MTDAPNKLPCPFCGESKLLLLECLETSLGLAYRIRCGNCGASSGLADYSPNAEAWNTRAVPQPPQEPTDAEVEAAAWTKTTDRLPEKPGVGSYEHVECLIVIRGEVKFALWNCEHLCWDDNDGDDFLYHPTEPTHWMPRPAPPRAALIAARKARA